MTNSSRIRSAIVALVSAVCVAACSDIFGPPDEKVTVVNAGRDTVAFAVWDLEKTSLIDPAVGPFPRSAFNGRILAPGESQRVPVSEISGYRRDAALRIFVWRVRNDSLRLETSVDWTIADQRRTLYRFGLLNYAD